MKLPAHKPAAGHLPSAPLLRQLLRFNLVGVLNTVVDFSAFFLLTRLGLDYLLAQTCAYGCGVANSYLCNKSWTFAAPGVRLAEVVRFAAVNLVALALSVLLIYIFNDRLYFSLTGAKVAATVLTMGISFGGSRLWVFKRGKG